MMRRIGRLGVVLREEDVLRWSIILRSSGAGHRYLIEDKWRIGVRLSKVILKSSFSKVTQADGTLHDDKGVICIWKKVRNMLW